MKKSMAKFLIRLLKASALLVAGAVLVLLVVGIHVVNSKEDLKVWHKVDLDAEFTAKSPVDTFEEYLELEEKLFTQLDVKPFSVFGPSAGNDQSSARLISRMWVLPSIW